MNKIVSLLFFLFGLLYAGQTAQAEHLIGGELSYRCLGGNLYEITLVMYRDCDCPPNTNCADFFDEVAFLYITNENDQYVNIPSLGNVPYLQMNFNVFTDETDVEPEDVVCIASVPDLCIKRGVYQEIIELPPNPGGYKFKYQRCCRNATISNILNPGSTGATWEISVPHTTGACNNSSPTFNNLPPIVICQDYPIEFDHSATDIDGDSLVYEMCTPFDGAEPDCPFIQPIDPNPACLFGGIPYAYDNVNWADGFTAFNQLGNNPALSIDPLTGLLTGQPGLLGQFVVGVCVSEYRNGVLLSTNKRDFQFNITDCIQTQAVPDADAAEVSPGVFEITNCFSYEVNFDNATTGAESYFWDFGDETTTLDVSEEEFPSYEYPDTGRYEITLVANPGEECADTAILLLNLYPQFVSDFSFFSEGCSYEGFLFNDESTSDFAGANLWYWNFGDGITVGPGTGPIIGLDHTQGTFENPVHYFQDVGILEVTLISFNELGCEDSQTYPVVVHEAPEAEINYDFLCVDFPTNFTGNTQLDNIVSWEWNLDGNELSGQTVSELYDTPGDYNASLLVESADGCVDSTSLAFTIFPTIFADAGLDTETCAGIPIELDASGSTGGAGLADNSYFWEPAEFVFSDQIVNPTILPDSDQVFTLTVSDPNGCSDQDEVLVNVWPLPAINAGADLDVCFGDSLTQLNGTVESTVVDFSWSPSVGLSDTAVLDPIVIPNDTTFYILSGIDFRGCENSDTSLVQLIPEVDPSLLPVPEICEGDTIQLFASGGTVYTWTPAIEINDPSNQNPIVWPSMTTTYNVNIANPPCFDEDTSVTVTVYPLPFVDAGTDATINVGEIINLNGTGEATYDWTPSDGFLDPQDIPNPMVQPFYTTNYVLTTLSEEGCENRDTVQIEVTDNFEFILPNAFSPNGDDLHDDIGISIALGIRELLDFQIYNRWGELIWEANSITDRWDGTFRGDPQEIGVYVYMIRGIRWRENDELIWRGNITLIR